MEHKFLTIVFSAKDNVERETKIETVVVEKVEIEKTVQQIELVAAIIEDC